MQIFIILFLALSLGCTKASLTPGQQPVPTNTAQQIKDDELQVFFSPNPDGHVAFVNLINSAQKNINLVMFRLTEDSDAQALIAAAKRQVKIRIILDREAMEASAKIKKLVHNMRNAGIEVKESSAGFSITHEKSMTVDTATALISTVNLTTAFRTTRDVGVMTKEAPIIAEFNAVFEADWMNADTGATHTPPLTSDKLLWSPINATERLMALIQTATKHIELYVENFTNDKIARALMDAADRKVKVRVLTPLCSLNANPFLNVPTLHKLILGNVQVKVMADPATESNPYIHAKSIIVDDTKTYVGSMNFSNNSLNKAREVGIIFTNKSVSQSIRAEFEQDWNRAIPLPPNPKLDACKLTFHD